MTTAAAKKPEEAVDLDDLEGISPRDCPFNCRPSRCTITQAPFCAHAACSRRS
jgi:hypothetical protein